jgi:hypothetical protein
MSVQLDDAVTLETVRTNLFGAFGTATTTAKEIEKVIEESKTGMLELQEVANTLIALKGKAVEYGQQMLASLEKTAAVLDLENVPESLRKTADSVKTGWAQSKLLITKAEQDAAEIRVMYDEVKNSASSLQLHVVRPKSDLFSEEDENSSDTFNVVNNPESVSSRISFIRATDGSAIGIAVIASRTTSRSTANFFYFLNYIEQTEAILGRKVDLEEVSDSVFVYRQAMSIAIALADAMVTQFGALSNDVFNDGDNGESLETSVDSLDIDGEDEDMSSEEDDANEIVQASDDANADASNSDEDSDVLGSVESVEEFAERVEDEFSSDSNEVDLAPVNLNSVSAMADEFDS